MAGFYRGNCAPAMFDFQELGFPRKKSDWPIEENRVQWAVSGRK
jgi:hypothetical protein